MMKHESWFMRYMLRAMIHVIVLVCAFDIYLTVKFHDSLIYTEENPIARLLIHQKHSIVTHNDSGTGHSIVHVSADVSNLVLAKTLGMIAAQIVLHEVMARAKLRHAFAITGPLFVFQVCLFVYLLFR